jgi:signal transduction histidine kinase
MVEGLLALAKLSRDALQPEPVDLSALARELLAQLREDHPQRAVEVLVHDGLRARADPRLAGLLLQNLLENAWKFTAGVAAARIEVGGDHAPDGQPVYWVADNGVGFDMADAGRLFDPFQRLHADGTFPGHGIGLANVKRVVERHGGRVWADARPGGGAVFRFTLGVPAGA